MGTNDHRIPFRVFVGKNDIPNLVHNRRETQRANHLREMPATFFLLKRRCGYEREPDLIRFNFSLTILKKLKRCSYTRIRNSSGCTCMKRRCDHR